MLQDVLITLAGYFITVSIILLWIFSSKQNRVPRTRRTAICISLRTLPLFIVFLFICQGLNVSVFRAMLILALSFWVIFIAFPSGLIGFFEPTVGILGVLYIFQQWILGWPDKQTLFLEPPTNDFSNGETLSSLIGQIGIASSTLRPMGKVHIGEEEYDAQSEFGYIENGLEVKVTGKKNTTLIVRPLKAEHRA